MGDLVIGIAIVATALVYIALEICVAAAPFVLAAFVLKGCGII